jgi:hypothetical protein
VTTCSSANSNPNPPPLPSFKTTIGKMKPNQLPTDESSKLTKAPTIELPSFQSRDTP